LVCETFFLGDSFVHRLDPRVRIVVAFAFSVVMALAHRFHVLAAGLGLAVCGALVARLPFRAVLKRMLALNLFMLALFVALACTMAGPALVRIGPVALSREGALRAAVIALKSNAIVLGLTVLLSTMEVVSLGHALTHLRVPQKLTQLFSFTVRYIDLLHHEYLRLVQAMKVRCFRPRMNRHTYRSLGYLVGMLLVRSLDRSERILAAMKCRGFRGRLYVLDHFALARRDVVFGVASLLVLLMLAWAGWS